MYFIKILQGSIVRKTEELSRIRGSEQNTTEKDLHFRVFQGKSLHLTL